MAWWRWIMGYSAWLDYST